MADGNKNKKYGKSKRKPANVKYLQSRRWESNGAKRVATNKRRAEAHLAHVRAWAHRIVGIYTGGLTCDECRKLVREFRSDAFGLRRKSA